MKKSIFTIGTIIAFTAGSTLFTSCGSNTHKNDEATEQHETDTSNETATETVTEATHVCPMHPEITGLEGDTCSKCGMDLVLAETSEDTVEHQH
jgi:hypothetical protein